MLRELYVAKQEISGHHKRWFQDDFFDLFVWQDKFDDITSFQLCYDRNGKERVIFWSTERDGIEPRLSHLCVDDGESTPSKNMSPVMIFCSPATFRPIIPHFKLASQQLDTALVDFILQKLTDDSATN